MIATVISLSSIELGERYRTDYGDVQELADSIKANGLISPLAVRDLGDGRYYLLAGGRRYKACALLGMPAVPVRVFPGDIGELSARTIELAENLMRKNLTWQEQATLTAEIDRLQTEQFGRKVSPHIGAEGWSQRDTAKLLNVDKQTVSTDLKLAEALKSSPDIAGCKNKSEALAVLAKREEAVILEELAKRAEKRSKAQNNMAQTELAAAYIVGDFFSHVKKLPDRSFGLVEIDPPYGVDLDVIRSSSAGGSLKRSANAVHTSSVIGYSEIPAEDYPTFMKRVLASVHPKVSDLGWIIVWFGSSRWHDSVRTWIEEAGFTPGKVPAIWVKPVPGAVINPTYNLGNSYEGFFYAHKTASAQVVRKGRGNVFSYRYGTRRGGHPAERPVELIQDILSTFGNPGDKVLVPFLGSGNTLLAAANLNMTGVGYDLEPSYRARFVLELEAQKHGAYTSYEEDT